MQCKERPLAAPDAGKSQIIVLGQHTLENSNCALAVSRRYAESNFQLTSKVKIAPIVKLPMASAFHISSFSPSSSTLLCEAAAILPSLINRLACSMTLRNRPLEW